MTFPAGKAGSPGFVQGSVSGMGSSAGGTEEVGGVTAVRAVATWQSPAEHGGGAGTGEGSGSGGCVPAENRSSDHTRVTCVCD